MALFPEVVTRFLGVRAPLLRATALSPGEMASLLGVAAQLLREMTCPLGVMT